MKSKSIRTLQILTIIGAAFYFIGTAMSIIFGDLPLVNLIDYLALVLLSLFIAGFVLSWTNIKIAGIIFMIWNAGVWISDLYLFRAADYSMMSAMASSFMFIGAFYLLEWYKTNKVNVPSKELQWKFMLRLLLINYVVLYSIVVFSELLAGEGADFFSFPFIIFPLLLFIFLLGFLLSWRREILAGYIFLLWTAILIFATFAYSEIGKLGPWIIFGVPVLLQGIFYIRNHYKFSNKLSY